MRKVNSSVTIISIIKIQDHIYKHNKDTRPLL